MNKKIIAFSLAFVIICGIFVGCKKKAADPVSIIVTDDNGKAVTDKNGAIVTKIAIPVTDKDGNALTEKATNSKGQVLTEEDGEEKMVVVTEPNSDSAEGSKSGKGSNSSKATTQKQGKTVPAPDKVPYSTTAPDANKGIDEWTFGALANVGVNAPKGWTNETVNQLVKDGTNIRVVVNPINYLGNSVKTADEYAKFLKENDSKGYKQLSYQKEVYADGAGIAILKKSDKTHDDGMGHTYGKYSMTYIFQTGDKVRVYFVNADNEKDAKISIKDIIANTYYRS